MELRRGVRLGLTIALVYSAIAAAVLVLSPGVDSRMRLWVQLAVFYAVAGTVGGALFGLLRPLQRSYVGKYLTALIIMFLVYGGGFAALSPLLGPRKLPLWFYLIGIAVFCLVTAPVTVYVFRAKPAQQSLQ